MFLTTENEYAELLYKHAKPDLKKALAECAHNILYGSIEFSEVDRVKLRSLVGYIDKLASGKPIDFNKLCEILNPVIDYVCAKGTTD
jgi:hypothetical protein